MLDALRLAIRIKQKQVSFRIQSREKSGNAPARGELDFHRRGDLPASVEFLDGRRHAAGLHLRMRT